MFRLYTESLLLDTGIATFGFAVNWLLQSTVLILAGLILGRLLRHRGSAALSAVYRTTLVAVLVCPLATCLLTLGGVSGWSLKVPNDWTHEQQQRNALVVHAGPLAMEPETGLVGTQVLIPPRGGSSAAPAFQAEMPRNVEDAVAIPTDAPVTSPISEADHDGVVPRTEPPVGSVAGSTAAKTVTIRPFGMVVIGISILWFAGATALLVRMTIAWWRLTRLRRSAMPAEPSIIETCRELSLLLDVSAPEVLRSPFFPSPCLAGLRQPAVLLPDTDEKLPIRDVLVHELAHLQRRDCHWTILRRLASSVFFFQPLLWRLCRQLEATAEEVCDDFVVQFGGNRADYARRLVDIAELSCSQVAAAAVGIVSLRSMLAKRVVRIMDTSRCLSTRAGSRLSTLIVFSGLIGTITVGFVGVGADQTLAEVNPQQSQPALAPSEEESKPVAPDSKVPPADGGAKQVGDSSPKAAANGEPAKDNQLRGRVVGADGKAVSGARLHWFRSRVHDLQPMKPKLVATTDDAGNFQFVSPSEGTANPSEPAWRYSETLVVTASGHGFTTMSPNQLRPEPPSDNLLGAVVQAFRVKTINLPAPGESIQGRLVNIDGQPVVGATIRIRWFDDKDARGAWQRDAEARDANNAAWRARVNTLLNVIEPVQLREVLPMATTDATGHFELRDLGPNRLFQLLVQGERIESTEVIARNQPGEPILIAPDRHAEGVTKTVYAREFLHAVGPSKPVTGRVIDIDTGDPIRGAIVRAHAVEGSRLNSSREREEFAVRSDAEGRYRITGLPIGKGNRLVAFTVSDVAYIPAGHEIDTSAGESTQQDFRLKRGVWAEGRVFDAATNKPFTGEITYYRFRDRKLEQEIPGLFRAYVDGCYWTNSNGEFRVPVQPSRGILAFRYDGYNREQDGIDRFPDGAGADAIEGSENLGGMHAFPTLPHYLMPVDYQRLAEVNPASGQTSIRVDMPLVASHPVKIRVIDADGKPVTEMDVYGANERWGWQSKPDSDFEIEDLRTNERRKVFVHHRGRNLAGGAIVKQGEEQLIEIKLTEAGSLTGRLVDRDGDPITDVSLFTDYERLRTDDSSAIWANDPKLVANPTTIPVDEKGRFTLEGLIPGWTYNAHASAPRKTQGQVMSRIIGDPFKDVRVKPGEKKDLGDLVVSDEESNQLDTASTPKPVVHAARVQPGTAREPRAPHAPKVAHITGQVTNVDGQPMSGVHLAAIGMKIQPLQGGDLTRKGEVLAKAISDEEGRYELALAGVSSKTHRYANLIALKRGAAVAWQTLNLDAQEIEAPLKLPKEEPIRCRVVDIEGQPAADVQIRVQSIMRRGENGRLDGVAYEGKEIPAAWFEPVTSDKQGRFTIHGVPAGHGVFLDVVGSDRFAPQDIAVNTGMSEQRGEHDATYRSLVKNVKPGEEAVLPLAPAQIFEGVVRYEDTGEPAPHARLTIWASQQPEYGSMISVDGQADDQGRYHISPRPGIRFGVTAYPPDGVPYLNRQTTKAIRWETGDRVKTADLTLPRGVLVQGRVVEAGTGAPIPSASIQYIPERTNNPRASDSILTGWQGIQVSNKDGQFQIVVLPGPGRLLAHASEGSYVLQEIGSSQLDFGKSGGQRYYAHAIQKLDLQPNAEALEIKIELQRGETVSGRIVTEQGESVDEAIVVSRLNFSPHSLWWRGGMPPVLGGRFELVGLKTGAEYPTYFLDAKRRLGATAKLKVSDSEPTVVLKPCGVAHVRFVDKEGQPVARYTPSVEMVVSPGIHRFNVLGMQMGLLAADSDYIGNIDRTNHGAILKTDQLGKVTLPALIPGATYTIAVQREGKNQIAKEFQVNANETIDLGDITVEHRE